MVVSASRILQRLRDVYGIFVLLDAPDFGRVEAKELRLSSNSSATPSNKTLHALEHCCDTYSLNSLCKLHALEHCSDAHFVEALCFRDGVLHALEHCCDADFVEALCFRYGVLSCYSRSLGACC